MRGRSFGAVRALITGGDVSGASVVVDDVVDDIVGRGASVVVDDVFDDIIGRFARAVVDDVVDDIVGCGASAVVVVVGDVDSVVAVDAFVIVDAVDIVDIVDVVDSVNGVAIDVDADIAVVAPANTEHASWFLVTEFRTVWTMYLTRL